MDGLPNNGNAIPIHERRKLDRLLQNIGAVNVDLTEDDLADDLRIAAVPASSG